MQEQLYANLLDQLAEMPVFFRRTLTGLSREALLRQPENDKSHLLEHLWHTLDCDIDLYGLRIRRILTEDRPIIEPVDVDLWPKDRSYNSRDGDQAIAAFEQQREKLISELQSLEPATLAKMGVRDDGFEVTILRVIQQLAAHD